MNHTMQPFLRRLSALALATLLAACGGGGGGGAEGGDPVPPPPIPNPAPNPSIADAQGIWQDDTASGVVLPDGQAWLVSSASPAAPVLLRLDLARATDGGSLTGSGRAWPIGSSAPASDVTVSGGSVAPASSLVLTIAGNPATLLALAYDSRYDTAARTADLIGGWKIVTGGNAVGGQLNFDGQGNLLAGSASTTGCSYTGSVRPHAEPIGVFVLDVLETCGSAASRWSGVATLSGAKARLSAAYLAGSARAGLLTLER